MLVYILKFSACLGVFLAFYKLFLERENMHQFKRFYLIGIVLTSITIPLITFTEYIEPQPVLDSISSISLLPTETVSASIENPINYLPIILWSIYTLGVLLFGLKFGYNLVQLIFKIKKNPKQKASNFINVLLNDLVTPHTFFSYIFLNKHKYETHQIPKEVLLHEQTHAKQKHSIDVLFIEILQIIFWFNPLVYFIKNSIKLNHEFLADKAVLNNGIQPTNYQHILLAFSANNSEPKLASAINYSSIKKRLTVMKTQTSKTKVWLRSFILLPLLALTLYSFSEHKKVVKENIRETSVNDEVTPLSNSLTKHTARSIDLEILNDGSYMIDNIKATKSTLVTVVNTLHQDITSEVRNKIMNIHISSSNEIPNKDVWHIYNSLLDYGFYRMLTPTQEIILEKGNTPFAITNIEHEASTKELSKYNRLAKLHNKQPEATRVIPFKDLTQLEAIYRKMSKKQKSSAQPFPNCPPEPALGNENKNQDGASREQMKEYERLAKHYNSMPKNKRIIKQKDVERMEYIYRLMSAKQKKDTEPFPNIPPPPAPPAAKEPQPFKIEVVPLPPPPPLKQNATEAEKKKYNEAMKQYKLRAEKVKHVENIERLKTEKMAYQEARAAKLKTEKGELTRVRELRSQEEVQKLKQEKLAYNEARAAKLKTQKGELARVREVNSKEVQKLKKEKMAYAKAQKARLSSQERMQLREIKTPNPPKSPLDHVIDMAKKDAIFYLEGKEISSDEAIKTLKANKSLNIQTLGSDSKKPKVYISKKPIVIEN